MERLCLLMTTALLARVLTTQISLGDPMSVPLRAKAT
jgi:hypothetical protein